MRNLIIILSSIMFGFIAISAQTTNLKVVDSNVDMMGISGRDSLTLKIKMQLLIRDEIQAMPKHCSIGEIKRKLYGSKSLKTIKDLIKTGDFDNKNLLIMVSAEYRLADGRVIYVDIKRYIGRGETDVSLMVIERIR